MRIGNRVLVDAAVDEGRHDRLHGFQIIFQSIFWNIRIRLELAGVDEEPPEAPVPPPLVQRPRLVRAPHLHTQRMSYRTETLSAKGKGELGGRHK